MITEKVGSYLLWIQGFRDARVIDSEKALHDLIAIDADDAVGRPRHAEVGDIGGAAG